MILYELNSNYFTLHWEVIFISWWLFSHWSRSCIFEGSSRRNLWCSYSGFIWPYWYATCV